MPALQALDRDRLRAELAATVGGVAWTRNTGSPPSFLPTWLATAINYAELDRMAEARAALAELERINPDFTVEELDSRNLVGVDPEFRSRMVAAARKAGMKSREAE